jgi:transcription elongation factor Elf1
MTDQTTLICPECRQGELVDTGDGRLTCANCGQRYVNPQRLCPFCEEENEPGAKVCARCGRSLERTCPRCSTVNAIRAERCAVCGLKFDTIGHIAAREELRHVDRFSRHAQAVSEVKATDLAHVQQRSDQMWEQERRLATLAAQRREQQRQERRMMYAAIAFVAVVALIIIVVAISAAGG